MTVPCQCQPQKVHRSALQCLLFEQPKYFIVVLFGRSNGREYSPSRDHYRGEDLCIPKKVKNWNSTPHPWFSWEFLVKNYGKVKFGVPAWNLPQPKYFTQVFFGRTNGREHSPSRDHYKGIGDHTTNFLQSFHDKLEFLYVRSCIFLFSHLDSMIFCYKINTEYIVLVTAYFLVLVLLVLDCTDQSVVRWPKVENQYSKLTLKF